VNTYKNQEVWRKLQKHLPKHNRITDQYYPKEESWNWQGNNIHLDRYPNKLSDKKIILLHGGGGNGRLLSFIGVPLYKNGFEVISPDLPGYGVSVINEEMIVYNMWVHLVNDLINKELKKDNRPIVLAGFSIGGMLAYHSACVNKNISGLVATNLLDQRIQKVRDSLALNKYISRMGLQILKLLDKVNGNIKLPMKFVANMKEIVNKEEILRLIIKDETGAGNKVNLRYLTSYLDYEPTIEPENFDICPVLLAHPAQDEWTDLKLSKLFYDKLKCKKELKILDKAGHFPVETPGLNQLEEYTVEFINQL